MKFDHFHLQLNNRTIILITLDSLCHYFLIHKIIQKIYEQFDINDMRMIPHLE